MAKTAEEKAAAKAAKDAEKAAAKADSSAGSETDEEASVIKVEYINPDTGLTTREFSLEVHGDDFKALAETFAEKFKGTIL